MFSGIMSCCVTCISRYCHALIHVPSGIVSFHVTCIFRHCVILCYMYLQALCHTVLLVSPGVCQCEEGWLGFSCAIAEQQPPTLVFIPTEMCDQRQDDCSSVTVYGTGFANTDTLTCHFIQVSMAQSIIIEAMRHVFTSEHFLVELILW